MNERDLQPARSFALNFGCKVVAYGGPGAGKTPICANTSPRPVLCITEPGMLSMRKSDVPTFPAFNPDKFDEFILWATTSAEARKYDTIVIDSVSQACEKKVDVELGGSSKAGNEQHGMRAYGKANRWMMEHLHSLYFLPQKHVVLIAKQQAFEQSENMIYKRPYFPGKELPVRVPHLFDFILNLGDFHIPGVVPSPTKAFRTKELFDMMARDRSGNLAEFEPPDLTRLFAKAMA